MDGVNDFSGYSQGIAFGDGPLSIEDVWALSTGQVALPHAAALVAGALPGAWAGALVSRRLPARRLRQALAGVVALTALRMLLDLAATLRLSAARTLGAP